MKKSITLTLLSLLASGYALNGAVSFTYNSTTIYDDSNDVFVPSSAVDSVARAFIRDPRAAMQTFGVGHNGYELTQVNIIVDRLFDGATAEFSIYDFGATSPTAPITQLTIDSLTPLITESISISGAQTAGFGTVGNWNDANSTLSWTLPSTVTLNSTNTYAFHMNGTNTDGTNSIVWVRDDDAGYAGGFGLYQDGNTADYVNTVFSDSNDDWSLAIVPEPSTYGLFLGIGAFAFILARRKQRIQNSEN